MRSTARGLVDEAATGGDSAACAGAAVPTNAQAPTSLT
jgi:hypothetical protein